MKRVYAAAAALVLAGAGIGFLLRPTEPASVEAAANEAAPDGATPQKSNYRNDSEGFSVRGHGGGGRSQLPAALHLGGGATGRTDCFFIRMGYNNASKPGADPLKKAQLRNAGVEGGCWMPED